MQKERRLLIPDIHQDHGFLARILEKECLDDFEEIILLGDYFDSRDGSFEGPAAARATARLIRQMETQLGQRLVLLWGNHDMPYYINDVSVSQPRNVAALSAGARLLGVEPESPGNAAAVRKEWDLPFWRKLQPFVFVGKTLVSHAGVHGRVYPTRTQSVTVALKQLRRQWASALSKLTELGQVDPLLRPGEVRGGRPGTIGGLSWLDWQEEFVDDLPFQQIVGHTSSASPRKRGNSHCIDYGQCAYAILSDELEVFPI